MALDRKRPLMVTRTVGHMRKGFCPVRVCNLTDGAQKIRVGERLATTVPGTVVNDRTRAKSEAPEVPAGWSGQLEALKQTTCRKENLPSRVCDDLRKLLSKHASLFAKDDNDLGRTSLAVHDIDTSAAIPIRQPPRRVPLTLQPELDKEMEKMLAKGVIEPGQSPWASPIVLVWKKDDSIRFCVDYRKLNAVTRFDANSLPRIDETIEFSRSQIPYDV
jgi:hypothetical protein